VAAGLQGWAEYNRAPISDKNLPRPRMENVSTEQRIDELEAKLSFAEDMVDTLNRVVFRQQEQLDRMQQQISMLHQQLQSVIPVEERNLRDEIPPHY
jgi:SlyX protein